MVKGGKYNTVISNVRLTRYSLIVLCTNASVGFSQGPSHAQQDQPCWHDARAGSRTLLIEWGAVRTAEQHRDPYRIGGTGTGIELGIISEAADGVRYWNRDWGREERNPQ